MLPNVNVTRIECDTDILCDMTYLDHYICICLYTSDNEEYKTQTNWVMFEKGKNEVWVSAIDIIMYRQYSLHVQANDQSRVTRFKIKQCVF